MISVNIYIDSHIDIYIYIIIHIVIIPESRLTHVLRSRQEFHRAFGASELQSANHRRLGLKNFISKLSENVPNVRVTIGINIWTSTTHSSSIWMDAFKSFLIGWW